MERYLCNVVVSHMMATNTMSDARLGRAEGSIKMEGVLEKENEAL